MCFVFLIKLFSLTFLTPDLLIFYFPLKSHSSSGLHYLKLNLIIILSNFFYIEVRLTDLQFTVILIKKTHPKHNKKNL